MTSRIGGGPISSVDSSVGAAAPVAVRHAPDESVDLAGIAGTALLATLFLEWYEAAAAPRNRPGGERVPRSHPEESSS